VKFLSMKNWRASRCLQTVRRTGDRGYFRYIQDGDIGNRAWYSDIQLVSCSSDGWVKRRKDIGEAGDVGRLERGQHARSSTASPSFEISHFRMNMKYAQHNITHDYTDVIVRRCGGVASVTNGDACERSSSLVKG